MFPMLTSVYLDFITIATLCTITPLIAHLARQITPLHSYDFTWICHENPEWMNQMVVPQCHVKDFLVALFHYQMHATDVIRGMGGTYTGEFWDIDWITGKLQEHNVDPWLITQYVRETTVG